MVGAVAGNREVGAFVIFEAEVEAASGEGGDFADPREIDEGRAVDAGEFFRVEFLFQLGDGVIDAVWLAFRDGPGEFVFGVEVGDFVEVEEPEAVAEAGGDAVGVFGFYFAKNAGDLGEERLQVGLGGGLACAAEAFDFAESAIEGFGFDGLEEVVDRSTPKALSAYWS